MSQYDAKKLESAITKAFLVFLIIVFMLLCYACSPYYYQSKGPKVTHVLALTEEGDTLKVPIKDIKPNVIYNVVGYDYYNYYPGRYNNWYYPYYHPNIYKPKPYNNNDNIGNNNNNNVISTPPAIKNSPVITPPKKPFNPKKNN